MRILLRRPTLLRGLALSLLLAAPTVAGTHEDPRIGFEVTVPKGWSEAPLHVGRPWIVAKYLSKDLETWPDPKGGPERSFHPQLTVLFFLNEAAVEGTEDQVDLASPYSDYLDYLKQTRTGFFVETEERDEEAELPVHALEVRHTLEDVAHRLVTSVYDTPLGEIAVQVDVLQKSWDDRKRDVYKIVHSLKPIERTESLAALVTYRDEFVSLFAWDLEASERAARRKRAEERTWEVAEGMLPDGWKASRIGDVPVVTTDTGVAKQVATQVTAVRGWLEEHFSAVGSGEYARMPLVRVFEDATAASEYRDGLAPMAGELVTNADGSKAFRQFPQWYSVVFTNDLGYANLSAMRLWFTDRDRDVFGSLPPWLLWGVSQLVGQAEAKGKRLGFSTSDMDRRGVGDSVSIAGLMKVPAADFEGSEVDRLADSLALVRFLCDGPGAKNKATRGIFPDYVRNLVAIVEEERAADEARKDTEPKTLQEQTDLERSRWDWVDERRDRFQAEAFERTFADWDAARWEKAEAAFQKSL